MTDKTVLITQYDIAAWLGRHVQTIQKRGESAGLPPYDLQSPTGHGAWLPKTIEAWDAGFNPAGVHGIFNIAREPRRGSCAYKKLNSMLVRKRI